MIRHAFGREALDADRAEDVDLRRAFSQDSKKSRSVTFGREALEATIEHEDWKTGRPSLGPESGIYNEQLKGPVLSPVPSPLMARTKSARKKGGTSFAGLLQLLQQQLQLLQQEHDRELNSTRLELEVELEAVQKELADARKMTAESSTGCVDQADELVQQHTIFIENDDPQMPKEGEFQTPSAAPHPKNPKNQPSFASIPSEGVRGSKSGKIGKRKADDVDPTHSSITPTLWDDENASLYHKKHEVNELATVRAWQTEHEGQTTLFMVDDSDLPSWRRKLMDMTAWQSFDIICVCTILSNSVVMGIQIDYTSRRELNPFDAPIAFRVIDRVYTVMFVVELMIRLAAFGKSFFYRHGWAWNCFDFIVVSTDAAQTAAEIWAQQEGDGSALGNFTALRMMRVLRVTRAIRVVRLVRFFRELRMMVYSVMKCGTSLMWSMLMFFAIIYIFSIFLLNAVGLYVYDNKGEDNSRLEHYRTYWSTLAKGMWTLFICMTGGISWDEIGDPLRQIGWVYTYTLGFFMFFTIFVVTNIITGIFVDTAIQSAQSDRDEVIMEHLHERDHARMDLQRVFQEADHDGSGTLSYAEFEAHLRDEKVRAHLHAIGLHVDEARALFQLLDIDRSDELGIDEFLFGCMRLKGSATSIDLATLMYENKRLIEGVKRFHMDVVGSLGLIHGKIEQIQSAEERLRRNDREKTPLYYTLHRKEPQSAETYMSESDSLTVEPQTSQPTSPPTEARRIQII